MPNNSTLSVESTFGSTSESLNICTVQCMSNSIGKMHGTINKVAEFICTENQCNEVPWKEKGL